MTPYGHSRGVKIVGHSSVKSTSVISINKCDIIVGLEIYNVSLYGACE